MGRGRNAAVVRLRVQRLVRRPAARWSRRRRPRVPRHRRVPRRPRPGAAVGGEGQQRHRGRGREGAAGRLARARTAAGRRLGEAARQRGRGAAADQHARREVRRALRPVRHGPRGPARRRRPCPAVPQRPQPGDRGGAVRAVGAAQRRRSGPAQDDHRGAEQGSERPGEPGQVAAQGAEHVHRRSGRPAQGHRPRPQGRRPARRAAREGEEDDRPGLRCDAARAEGPCRPATRSDKDAHRPVEAGQDGHQGGHGLARRHGREPQTVAADPAAAEQGGG